MHSGAHWIMYPARVTFFGLKWECEMWDKVLQLLATSMTETRLMELFGFVMNTKIAEGHHSS